jgi:hypothetical protein
MFLSIILLILLFSQPLFAADIQEFSAEYEIFYGDIHLGKANYRFSHVKDNDYRFDFASELRFLIFWDERVVSSDLVFENQHLRPSYYRHDRKGTGRDYLEEIVFDHSNRQIRATYRKESKVIDYEKDIIDGLTMQLQMMLDLQRGVEHLRYKIIDFNKLKEYEFSFAGSETINIQDMNYDSVMFQVVRDNERRKTQMWFKRNSTRYCSTTTNSIVEMTRAVRAVTFGVEP